MSEYFVGTTGSNSQTTFEAFSTSEVLDDLGLNTTDSPTFSGVFLEGSGNTIFSVDGSNGRLFGVTDEVTGTVFSVNDAAGLPILEVESTADYDKITIGEYGSDLLVLSGQTSAQITGSQIATQDWINDQGFLTSATDGNYYLDGISKSSNTLTFSVNGTSNVSYTFGSNAFTSTTIPSAANNATITISAGTNLGGGGNFTTDQSSNETITINHDTFSRSDTTESQTLAFGGTFTGIDSITSSNGHITSENTVTYTLPSETYSSASDLLTAIKTVDGAASALDADLLDAQHGSYYLNYNNFTNTPTIPSAANDATITISAGTALGGGGNFTTDQSANETITINHDNISRSDTTETQTLAFGGTFTGIDSITSNSQGHITSENTVTYTLPTETYSTASELLTALLGVDGAGSNLDSDKLDGQQGSYYLDYDNFSNTPTIPSAANNATITLQGGGGITTSIGNFTTNQGTNETLTISHSDTSSQSSSTNSGRTYIQSLSLDGYGHVTSISTATETVANTDVDVNKTNLLARLAQFNSSETVYIGDADDDTTVVIRGTLQVDGTTTTVNSNTLSIGDNNIVLNNDVTGTPTQNAGITVERGTSTNASLIWDEANDYWKAGLSGSEVQLALTNGTYSGLRAQATTKGDVGLGNVANTLITVTSSSVSDGTNTFNKYSHPSHTSRTVDVNANSGATVLSTLDLSVNTLGHVTAASATTRTLTLANLGYTGATDANNYSLPLAASGTRGGVQIGYAENGKNYPVELSSEKMFVNVPWTDTNTTYSTATSSTLGLVKIGYTENGKNYPVELSNGQMFVNVPWTDTDTDTNTFRTITAGGNTLGATETLAFTAGSNVTITESAGAVTINSSHPSISAASSSNNSGRTYIQDITLDGNGHVTGITTATETVTDTNTTYSAGNGLALSGTTFKIDDPVNLSQLTESTDATDDKFLIWDESTSLWKYMTLDDLQDAIDTNTTYSLSSFGVTATAAELNKLDGVTATTAELNYTDGVTSNIQTQLNAKASSSHNHTLDSLSNVTITSNSSGEILKWNGSAWINNTLSEAGIASASTLSSHTGSTSNPHSVTKSQVGLGNVTNESKATMFSSAALTGTPTAPTAATSTNTTQIATTAFVKAQGYVTTDTNTTYSAGNGLSLSGTTFKIDDPVNLSQLTESTDATSDKILLWDESASLWKYMTMDDLQDSIDTNTNTFRTVTAGGNTLGASETLAFTAGSNVTITESAGAVTINSSHPSVSAASSSNNSGRTYIQDITLDSNGHVTAIATATETVTDTNTTYSAGNGLSLSSTTFSLADPATLSQLTEGTDATDDKFMLWDESASTWKYMTMDDLQDSIDTNTTYTLGSFGVTATAAEINKLDGVTATTAELNYVDGVTSNIQTQLNAKQASGTYNTVIGTDTDISYSGATVLSAMTMTDGVIQSHSSRTLTLADLGYTGATNANNYSLPEATATTRGGIELFSNTDQSVAANAVTTTAGRTYGIQLNSAGQAVVNVPWSDTNTTYSVGDGGLTQKNFTTTLYNKLNAIEASADVTDATNVASAGAIMDGDFTANGLMKRTGAGTYTSITDNSSNWNTAYGWGDHASAGYLTAHPTISAASSSDNSGRTYIQDITLDSNGHVTGITTATETVTDTNTTYTAGNGLVLSGTTFKIDDPVNLSQLTESTDATSDKILLWDESASLWKYMTMDDLQDSIDTNTNTNYYLNGITKSGNTLTFSVSGATNQTYEFGANAFTSTTIPTNNNQLTNGASYITASSTDTLTNKTWNGNTIASSYLDADTAHLSGSQTFTGAKVFKNSIEINQEVASNSLMTSELLFTNNTAGQGATVGFTGGSPNKFQIANIDGATVIYSSTSVNVNGSSLILDTVNAATTDTDKFLVSDSGTVKYRTGSQVRSDIGASPTAGSSSITTVGTISSGTWNGSVISSAYLDSDTAHLSGTQTFSGAKTFSANVTFGNSSYYNNSYGNWGLGIASTSSERLKVQGDVEVAGGRFYLNSSQEGIMIGGTSGSGEGFYMSSVAGPMRLNNLDYSTLSSNEVMTRDGFGNVNKMTHANFRDLISVKSETDLWQQTGRIFSPMCDPLRYSSNGTTGALSAVCFTRAEVTSTANAWAQNCLMRTTTNEISWSGGGTEFSRKLGASFKCSFVASGTTSQSIRFMFGGRANSVQAAGSNPLVSKGFGAEFRSRSGTTVEWRVIAHNGSTFSSSSWTDIPSNTTGNYTKELYIYSDGAGNIEAGLDDRGGDGSSWTTKTTTGGPTSNGTSTYPYLVNEVINASSGSSYARSRIYDYKIFSE